MNTSKVIPFPAQRAAACPADGARTGFDWDAYERRAVRRFRRASVCAAISTLVEAIVTVAIGACIVLSTLAFAAML